MPSPYPFSNVTVHVQRAGSFTLDLLVDPTAAVLVHHPVVRINNLYVQLAVNVS